MRIWFGELLYHWIVAYPNIVYMDYFFAQWNDEGDARKRKMFDEFDYKI